MTGWRRGGRDVSGVERARELGKKMSPPELALWRELRRLRERGWHFRRQSPEPPCTLDFVCRKSKLMVEVDGLHHAGAEQSEHDAKRDAYSCSREVFAFCAFGRATSRLNWTVLSKLS